jgi:hypothetical protein
MECISFIASPVQYWCGNYVLLCFMLRDSILMVRRKSRPLTGRFALFARVHCVAVSFAALNKQTNGHSGFSHRYSYIVVIVLFR